VERKVTGDGRDRRASVTREEEWREKKCERRRSVKGEEV
jgi:hypothetical protein